MSDKLLESLVFPVYSLEIQVKLFTYPIYIFNKFICQRLGVVSLRCLVGLYARNFCDDRPL